MEIKAAANSKRTQNTYMVRTKQTPRRVDVHAKPKAVSKQVARKAVLQQATTPKKRAYRPGALALREVRRYQRSTELLIPRAPFRRLVREITQGFRADFRMQSGAIAALQESGEAYLTRTFEDAQLCAQHARRSTLMPRDLRLTMRIRGEPMLHA